MSYQQMIAETHLQNAIVRNECISSNHKQLFSCFNSMKSYGFFIAIPNTSVPVVVGKIFYYKFLANIYGLVNIFST